MPKKKVIILLLGAVGFLCITAFAYYVDNLSAEENLGKRLYFDQNLSLNRNQSCSSCHDPDSGFADPASTVPVSRGSDPTLFGGRNAPSAAYAAFSPFFYWDSTEEMYIGGQFWDGRANTLADQAGGPFINPVEMALPNKWAFVSRLKEDFFYIRYFKEVYGLNLRKIPFYVPCINTTPPGVLEIYDRATKAIAAFEKTRLISNFSSKFDYSLIGEAVLSTQEAEGFEIFNNKGQCAACHISDSSKAPDGSIIPPLFTDFTYDNLGIPPNMKIPGAPHPVDNGLGGRPDIAAMDPEGLQNGKFKVVTLRNIEKTKPYGHNGVFETLEQIIHFYNTRDVLGQVYDNLDPNFGITGWPLPEVEDNVNVDELGDLQLTTEEEAALVAFLKTLTDGYGEAHGLDPIPVTFPPLP
jgi:cytochrome c peroxidase